MFRNPGPLKIRTLKNTGQRTSSGYQSQIHSKERKIKVSKTKRLKGKQEEKVDNRKAKVKANRRQLRPKFREPQTKKKLNYKTKLIKEYQKI